MRKLLNIEWIKTISSNTFRTILSLHFLFFILVVLGISRIDFSTGTFSIEKLYTFPSVWEYFTWIASWFNILLAILIIVLVSNEFRYNTFRQHLVNGLSRGELLWGKLIAMFYISIYGLILVIGASLVSGFIVSPESEVSELYLNFDVVFVYFVQTLSYMSLGLLIAIIFRNNALSIIVFILYLFPGEIILRKLLLPSFENYFPVKIISGLTPLPEMLTKNISQANQMAQGVQGPLAMESELGEALQLLIAVIYFLLFTGISYWILKKKSI
jgi:ABC-type transport system involved in multi-copper enzyme maturation permease subunit